VSYKVFFGSMVFFGLGICIPSSLTEPYNRVLIHLGRLPWSPGIPIIVDVKRSSTIDTGLVDKKVSRCRSAFL
jgi:hypothetical protein